MNMVVYLALAFFVLLVGILSFVVKSSSRKRTNAIPKRTNRRSSFRLSLWEKECSFRLPSTSDSIFFGTIRDISSTGMRLIAYEDLTGIDKIRVDFELQVSFSLLAKIERRKKLENGMYEFGVRFLFSNQETEQQLFKILWDKSKEKVM